MRNYQILIDEIRSTFASDEMVSPELYRSLAEDYAKACKAMIGRLKTCVSYLRSGNTTEAVRLADVEPNLFDIYNLLDFPEREEWVGVLESFGYKLPPPFPKELAQQLNDAYCQSALLEPLQKRYRVLALERAPLSERLKVLRSIAAADPVNPMWHKDLETFEEERLKELGRDVDKAVAENDDAEIQRLQKEVEQNRTVPVPAHIRDKLNATLRGIRFQSLNRQLEQLVERLRRAHDAKNVEQGQSLVDEIREIVDGSGMAMPAEISDQAEAAVRWLAEEKKRRNLAARYEAALRQLKNELRSGASVETLSRAHDSLATVAGQVSQTIPETLEGEYRETLRSRERKTQQKRHIGIAAAAVTMVLLLAGTFAAMYAWQDGRAATQTAATLREMLEPEQPPSNAAAFLADLEANRPGLLKRNEIAELSAELKRRIEQDNERKSLFDEYFQRAKDSAAEGRPPDTVAYQQATKLVKSESEQNRLDTLRPFFERYIAEQQHQVDAAVEAEMSRLSREAMSVRQDRNAAYHKRQDRLKTIARDLEQLAKTPGMSDGLTLRLKQAVANVSQAAVDLAAERERSEQFDKLLDGVGNVEAYTKALTAYADAFPERAESPEFRETASQSNVWGRLSQTDAFRQSLAAVRSHDDDEATAAARALESYKRRYAAIRHFAPEDFVKYGLPYLETVTRRTLDPLAEQKPFESVKTVLRELSQLETWVIYESPDSAWFYVLRKPNGRGSYSYVTELYAKPETRNFDESYFADVPKVNQYGFAISALRSLDGVTHETWSDMCYSLVKTLYEADGVDPILKVVLMKLMIADFSKYDSVFAERFRSTASLLDEDTPSFRNVPNWMTGNAASGNAASNNTVRNKCRSILARITFPSASEMQTAYDRVDTALAALAEPQGEYRWIGFALRQDETPTLMSRETPSGTLYFVRPLDDVGDDVVGEPVECGRIDASGVVTFDAETALRQGEPVFVARPRDDAD